jgi:hypothetical protein
VGKEKASGTSVPPARREEKSRRNPHSYKKSETITIHSPGTFTSDFYHYTVPQQVALDAQANGDALIEFPGPALPTSDSLHHQISALPRAIIGHGVRKNLKELRYIIETFYNADGTVKKVRIVGHSRGALQAIQMAHIIQALMPGCAVELYLLDPVIGQYDSVGVERALWNSKFIIPNNVSKCVIAYCGTEDRFQFHGVIPPEKFTISESTAFFSFATRLNHSQIASGYEEEGSIHSSLADLLKGDDNDSSKRQKLLGANEHFSRNQDTRDAIIALFELEMGLRDSLNNKEKEIVREFLREDFASSKQRGVYQFYQHQNLDALHPDTQKLILDVEGNAKKSIELLQEHLLLNLTNQPLGVIQLRDTLHKDIFISQVVAVLNGEASPLEKYRKINQLCYQDKEQDNELVKAVKEILKTPDQISSNNWLLKLTSIITDFKKESRIVAMEKFRRKTEGYDNASKKLDSMTTQLEDLTAKRQAHAEKFLLAKFFNKVKNFLSSLRFNKVNPDENMSASQESVRWNKSVVTSYSSSSLASSPSLGNSPSPSSSSLERRPKASKMRRSNP